MFFYVEEFLPFLVLIRSGIHMHINQLLMSVADAAVADATVGHFDPRIQLLVAPQTVVDGTVASPPCRTILFLFLLILLILTNLLSLHRALLAAAHGRCRAE